MESSNEDDQNLKAINASVGRLVWVRRGNNTWWPGQTLLSHEKNSLVSSKPGTPIKLLCREDVSVEWYVLDKSKMVKPFRCGEYDACIEKAKAKKRSDKRVRREDAIKNALEIESAYLSKEVHQDNKLCTSKRRRRRTPNDSEEEEEEEGTKRMRGLEDIGKEHACGLVVEHKQEETGLICDLKLNNVCSRRRRRRSQVIIANESPKKRNQQRQLKKVFAIESIESMKSVVTCDQLVLHDNNKGKESEISSTTKWQLKGKRNSRQMSKKQEEANNNNNNNNNTYSLVPYSALLYEVKIKLKPNHNKAPSVPLVSRMSEYYRKAIVGHPLTVEILEEEGYCNGIVMSQAVVKEKPLVSKKKSKSLGKPLKSKKKQTRSISTLTRQSKKKVAADKAKAKETVLACVPLKVVFSRINQVLKGSARQIQHQALLLAAKT